ncbi:5314_t:CDS:2, partial [Dentiscutata heterogama]
RSQARRAIFFGIMSDYFIGFQIHAINANEFFEESTYLFLIYVYFAISTFVATYISMATWAYTSE